MPSCVAATTDRLNPLRVALLAPVKVGCSLEDESVNVLRWMTGDRIKVAACG